MLIPFVIIHLTCQCKAGDLPEFIRKHYEKIRDKKGSTKAKRNLINSMFKKDKILVFVWCIFSFQSMFAHGKLVLATHCFLRLWQNIRKTGKLKLNLTHPEIQKIKDEMNEQYHEKKDNSLTKTLLKGKFNMTESQLLGLKISLVCHLYLGIHMYIDICSCPCWGQSSFPSISKMNKLLWYHGKITWGFK